MSSNVFPKIVGKYIVQPGRPQVTIRRTRIACWIRNATNMLSNTCNTYCFCTAAMVTWKHLIVTLYYTVSLVNNKCDLVNRWCDLENWLLKWHHLQSWVKQSNYIFWIVFCEWGKRTSKVSEVVFQRLLLGEKTHSLFYIIKLLKSGAIYAALDRTLWRTRFGRGYGPAVRQPTEQATFLKICTHNLKFSYNRTLQFYIGK